MKPAHPTETKAFTVTEEPLNLAYIQRHGNRSRDRGMLTWVHGASKDPNLTVGFVDNHTYATVFHIFYKGNCEGTIVFDYLEGRSNSREAKLNVSHVATPHAALTAKVRGLGIASFLYRRAMDAGITLVAYSHTDMAARVWDSLSTKGYKLYHFENGHVVPDITEDSLKILTKKRI
jgi:hypothetical protein